jgi:hypothetical protein
MILYRKVHVKQRKREAAYRILLSHPPESLLLYRISISYSLTQGKSVRIFFVNLAGEDVSMMPDPVKTDFCGCPGDAEML